MCLTEFDEEVYKQILREDSYEEGLTKGETVMARLVACLLADGRLDDLQNLEQRKESLYAEYRIK